MKELTIEITNLCPFDCTYCSSDRVYTHDDPRFKQMPFQEVLHHVNQAYADGVEVLHISGGEPLMHPNIGNILQHARTRFGRNLVVHTNLVPQIAYNASVLEGVKVHCLVTPEDVDEVHVLKRVRQGHEATVPEVHLSRNFLGECPKPTCDHQVIRPDGTAAPSPCRKEEGAKS